MINIYKNIRSWGLALVALFFALPAFAQETVDVTFTFNASTVYANVDSSYTIKVIGTLKGSGNGSGDRYQTFASGETLDWGSTSEPELQHVGGDYWQGTFSIVAGDTILWRYNISNPDLGFEYNEPDVAGSDNPIGWGTRFHIATEDVVLPADYIDNSGNSTRAERVPFETDPDSVTLRFRVNVGSLVQTNTFDPDSQAVGLRGSVYRDWGSTLIFDAEERPGYASSVDYFYSTNFKIHRDSVAAFISRGNDSFNYKFVTSDLNGNVINWEDNGLDEASRNDRFHPYSVSDTTFQYKYFNNNAPTTDPVYTSNIEFRVNTQMLEALGLFNSSIDVVEFRGGPNGWGGDEMSFSSSTRDYSYLLSDYSHTEGATINYKYYINYGEERSDVNSENYIEAAAEDDAFGYEEPATTGGGDRQLVLGTATSQSAGEVNFNDIELASVILEDMDVTFEIDMNPALTAEEPFNPTTDSVYLHIESKVLAYSQKAIDGGYDWIHGGAMFDNATSPEDIEFLRFKPVEGESNVYRLTLNLKAPFPNDFGYVVAYGSVFSDEPLVVNGSGFARGRRYYQFIQPVAVEDAGVDELLGQIYEVTWPESYALERVAWKQQDLPTEDAPNYAALAGISSIREELPTAFTLEQNYPNPFNPTTNIAFNIPSASRVTLEVYNMLGQRVATLLNRQMTAGSHTIPFNAANFGSGIYIYRLTAGDFIATKRMTLIK